MKHDDVLKKTKDMIHEKFDGESSGHDYWHMYRVWRLAEKIAVAEGGVDMFVLELSVWLHDLADHKFNGGDFSEGPKAIATWLNSLDVEFEVITRVQEAVASSSFSASLGQASLPSLEAIILHDADKLDAMGAIGVARAFAFGGMRGQPIHDPIFVTDENMMPEEYKKRGSYSPVISHFYEKLLKLKYAMRSVEGRRLAKKRHDFLEEFVSEFLAEWDGKK